MKNKLIESAFKNKKSRIFIFNSFYLIFKIFRPQFHLFHINIAATEISSSFRKFNFYQMPWET